MVIIDSHAHITLASDSAEQLLKHMNQIGISISYVVGGGLLSPQQISRNIADPKPSNATFDNLSLLEICHKMLGRLRPFYFANPNLSPGQYLAHGKNFYGLKLAPAIHGIPLEDARHWNWYKAAEKIGHPVYLHCLESLGFQVGDLCLVATTFPKVNFILGHGGGGQLNFEAVETIKDIENIYYETSGAMASVVRFAVETIGVERVLFGSEYPLQDSEAELLKIKNLRLSPSDSAMVLGGAISRLTRKKSYTTTLRKPHLNSSRDEVNE
jgi:uncharacterized protein